MSGAHCLSLYSRPANVYDLATQLVRAAITAWSSSTHSHSSTTASHILSTLPSTPTLAIENVTAILPPVRNVNHAPRPDAQHHGGTHGYRHGQPCWARCWAEPLRWLQPFAARPPRSIPKSSSWPSPRTFSPVNDPVASNSSTNSRVIMAFIVTSSRGP